MWKFIVDVVHDFVSSLQPDVGRGFLHVSNVFLFYYNAVVIWNNLYEIGIDDEISELVFSMCLKKHVMYEHQ